MTQRSPALKRLEDLAARKAQIAARIESLSTRVRAENKRDDDRCKWLLGTLVFEHLADSPELRAWVRREMPARLTARDEARGLWKRLFPEDEENDQ